MLFLDGVYIVKSDREEQEFIYVSHHSARDIKRLVHQMSQRMARYLTKAGLIEADVENGYLLDELSEEKLTEHQSYSIHYRISTGFQKGKKVFTLQTLPPMLDEPHAGELTAKIAGFSLHAGVRAGANERVKLERLCRYMSRPPVAASRLSLTQSGNICYALKTPYRDGTTHVVFEPLDFISKLAALVPSPRVNLTRFYGVFAPNSSCRARIIIRKKSKTTLENETQTEGEKRRAMTWSARLKRAFNLDIKTCQACGGVVKIIGCIEDPIVISKILNHLQRKQTEFILPVTRAPPANLLCH